MPTLIVVEDFMLRLPESESALIILRDELYKGSWKAMTRELQDRLAEKPCFPPLQKRIQKDLDSITKLRNFEREYDVNLAKFIKERGD